MANQECGVIEDPQTGGYLFLSEGVKPLRDKRNAHVPTALEINQTRVELLQEIFEITPSAKIENSKEVKAGVRIGKNSVVGEDNDIQFRIDAVDASSFDQSRTALLSDTNSNIELKNSIVWLMRSSEEAEDLIAESCRSDSILRHRSVKLTRTSRSFYARNARQDKRTGRCRKTNQRGPQCGDTNFPRTAKARLGSWGDDRCGCPQRIGDRRKSNIPLFSPCSYTPIDRARRQVLSGGATRSNS